MSVPSAFAIGHVVIWNPASNRAPIPYRYGFSCDGVLLAARAAPTTPLSQLAANRSVASPSVSLGRFAAAKLALRHPTFAYASSAGKDSTSKENEFGCE